MTNNECLIKFFDTFVNSCAEIGPEFFRLNQANQSSEYRERVYAYELYHILRKSIGGDKAFNGLSLNGEVDKAGRADFSNEKPDLLLHSPGNKDSDIAIVEIKRCNGTKFREAVDNLIIFTTTYGYAGGILLAFGISEPPAMTMPERCRYLWHQAPGIKPVLR